ncbi:hypothetical protein [Actinoplanes aureus]|uniref:Uncharacterized protein n=1 Tax=Actinoplanes aureus TaxID=2792083 RepID=A0A931CMN6_9ACTN|nr:hypothetical protein [Actinoplanes aureus]MBG0569201.1 hypothetical protein [Actinoplanes aureus]
MPPDEGARATVKGVWIACFAAGFTGVLATVAVIWAQSSQLDAAREARVQELRVVAYTEYATAAGDLAGIKLDEALCRVQSEAAAGAAGALGKKTLYALSCGNLAPDAVQKLEDKYASLFVYATDEAKKEADAVRASVVSNDQTGEVDIRLPELEAARHRFALVMCRDLNSYDARDECK